MKTNKKSQNLQSLNDCNSRDYLSQSRLSHEDKTKPSYHFRAIARVALLFFLIAGSAFRLQAQEVNMSRYITLTVENGEDITLDLWADADDTPIKIESGGQTYNTTIDAQLDRIQ